MRMILLTWVAMLVGLSAGVLLSGLAGTGQLDFTGAAVGTQEIPQLSLDGYSPAEVSVNPLSIIITSGCTRMSMSTYDFQTDSIKRGLDGDRSGRPNAHDLMSDIADTFGMEVIMVKVEAFTGDAYFAKIIMRQGDRVLNLDSKPSDAIALAVRAGAPIYVKDTMLKQLGEEVC